MNDKPTENQNKEKPEIKHPDNPHTIIPNKADEKKDHAIGEKAHHSYQKPGETENFNKTENELDKTSPFQDEPNMSDTRETNNWNQKESEYSGNKYTDNNPSSTSNNEQ